MVKTSLLKAGEAVACQNRWPGLIEGLEHVMTKRFGLKAAGAVAVVAVCVGGAGGCAGAKAHEKSEANEQKVELSQVPAAVRETLTKEAQGAKIDKVDKETDDGKTVYETDVELNGKN